MIDEPMTFGEFLITIMENKNVSVTKLARLTGMKSRNSLQRILKDEVSIRIIEAFKEKLVETASLQLSRFELQQLDQSIEVTKIGKDAFRARNILLQIFDSRGGDNSRSANPIVQDPVHEKSVLLHELFASYQSYSKIRLLIFNLVSSELTSELIHLMKNVPPDYITVSQVFYIGYSPSYDAAAFSDFLRLFNFENYQAFSISGRNLSEHQLGMIPDSIVVDKEIIGTGHMTDLITLEAENGFSYVTDLPDSLYSFYLYHFERIKANGQSMKRKPNQNNPIERVNSICATCLPLERNSAKYIVKHSLSTTMIPFYIIHNMIIGQNYFGKSKDDPQITTLIKIFSERFHAMYRAKEPKVNLMTKRGLLDFTVSGLLSDHFCYLRPFTKEEIKTILVFILEQLENNSYFKIRLLKNDYAIGNIEFTYFEDKLLWVSDTCSGYQNDYYEGVFDSAPILRIFDDFIKNELIRNHTLPETESINFLKYLISIV